MIPAEMSNALDTQAVYLAAQVAADAHFASLPPEARRIIPAHAWGPRREGRRWDGKPDHLFHLLTQIRRSVRSSGQIDPAKPVPGCDCSACTGVVRPVLQFPRTAETLDVEAARAVPLLDVLDLLRIDAGRRVGRTYRIPCPVHRGEGPNCSVDPAKGLWKCFTCGEGGDGIRLMMEVRGLPFLAAVRELLNLPPLQRAA